MTELLGTTVTEKQGGKVWTVVDVIYAPDGKDHAQVTGLLLIDEAGDRLREVTRGELAREYRMRVKA